jgi:hypothetical protein
MAKEVAIGTIPMTAILATAKVATSGDMSVRADMTQMLGK